MGNLRRPKDEEGQATVEYILILSVVVLFFVILKKGIDKADLAGKLAKPITKGFAASYKYGNAKAQGYDEGTPDFHPRVFTPNTPSKNFRIFINPAPR